jgi:hypothetical protein
MIVSVAVVLVLAVLDEKGELLAAAKKTAEAKSYTFKGDTKLVLPEGLDRSGGGEPLKFEGKHEREAGLWVKTDAFEYVTFAGKTAMRPVSEWRALKDDNGNVQRLLYQSLAGARPPRAPHEDFAAWAKGVASVKRIEGKDRVYEADFTPEHARELVTALFPIGPWLDRIPTDRPTASAKVWVDESGRIQRMEISTRVTASIQGSLVQLVATRTTTFSDVDATKVQVPDEARKILEAK